MMTVEEIRARKECKTFDCQSIQIDSKEEQGTTWKSTQKTTQKISVVQQKRFKRFIAHPTASRTEHAIKIGDITVDSIKYHFKKFQQLGVITRIDVDNNGYWEVLQE